MFSFFVPKQVAKTASFEKR